MTANLTNDWGEILKEEFQQPYYLKLKQFLIQEYRTEKIFPTMHDIFNALHFTSCSQTKVIILGQDPYHGPGQAHGLSFSVQPGTKIPPSLKNIFQELQNDCNFQIPNHGCLKSWTKQGVLLLNAVLTVRCHQARSHQNIGWEKFTSKIISQLNESPRPLVFILWGRDAAEKIPLITNQNRHLIIKGPHPSPLSAYRGFFGSRPFSRTNQFLSANNLTPINWNIPNI